MQGPRPPRRRYEQQPTRKVVTGAAAPGALVETTDGALLVQPFEHWPYYTQEQHLLVDNEILDARFKQRLQLHYSRLERLVRVPSNELRRGYQLANNDGVLLGKYFPEWAYCPISNRFQKVADWRAAWTSNGREANQFNPPKSLVPRTRQPGSPVRMQRLEQVRFVLVSPAGEVADIPWDRWLLARQPGRVRVQERHGELQATMLDFEAAQPAGFSFIEYSVFDRLGDLSGIFLTAKNQQGQPLQDANGQQIRTSLNGLYSLRVRRSDLVQYGLLPFQNGTRGQSRPGDEHILFRPVIRSSNSIYYANKLESLYIPTRLTQRSTELIDLIRTSHEEGDTAERISRDIKRHQSIEISVAYITALIDADFELTDEVLDASELLYRQAEYDYLTRDELGEHRNATTGRPELVFTAVPGLQLPGLARIYHLDQLKMVSVQPSYSRLDPLPSEQALQPDVYSPTSPNQPVNEREGSAIRKHYISIYGNQARFLPAYESYGEGIFLQFDRDELQKWEDEHNEVREQARLIQANYLQSWQRQAGRVITASEVMIHTFSHLLLKELEFQCGYPVTSLRERLYCGDGMAGVLLFTVAGAEGSYGGLVSLSKDGRFEEIIRTALMRATDCSSDPVCWHPGEQGQGVGGLNMAACSSCSLVPETSCEEFNSFLDRRLVIDPKFGYFRKLVAAGL
ncbi:hypothetical protein [Hymenobacter daeguensis]